MVMTIKEAVVLGSKGKRIPVEKVKEGFPVDVTGITTNKQNKNIFIFTRMIRENGSFFLKDGKRAIIIPKTSVSL